MHYYQHHIGDFIKATARLSDSQTIGYLRLLWMYYDSEKPLNKDVEVLAFQIGSTIEDTELLLRSFFSLRETGWHQTRCDKEIQDYHEFLAKKSNAGKASAQQRKNKSSTDVQHVLNTSSTDVQLTNNHKPTTINQETKKKATSVAAPEGVSPEIWDSFVQHRKAKKAPITELVISSIEEQAKLAGWTLENALKETCVRGWQSFKAEWVAKKPGFVKPLTAAERATNSALGRPADYRIPTPEEQAERAKRIAMR